MEGMELTPDQLWTALVTTVTNMGPIVFGCAAFIVGACGIDAYFCTHPLPVPVPQEADSMAPATKFARVHGAPRITHRAL